MNGRGAFEAAITALAAEDFLKNPSISTVLCCSEIMRTAILTKILCPLQWKVRHSSRKQQLSREQSEERDGIDGMEAPPQVFHVP